MRNELITLDPFLKEILDEDIVFEYPIDAGLIWDNTIPDLRMKRYLQNELDIITEEILSLDEEEV